MQALARGHSILVLDDPSQNHSSAVAAGLFNPITGKKLVKTWFADHIFPALERYYLDVERSTGRRFFYELPIYRPFATIQQQNEWMARSVDNSFKEYISGVFPSSKYDGKVNDPFGGILLKHTGYLDTTSYLEAVREYLQARGAFERARFDPDKLRIRENQVAYEDVQAKKIIFCQGVQNSMNPWFDDIPVKSLKGEFLTVQSHMEKDVILNRGVYMVPGTGQNEWRVGATYSHNDQSPEITANAREELTHKLNDLINLPYTITGQQWGVRPTTPDRKPVLGAHPQYKSLVIFNGFGTKGVSLAPYFSEVLIRWVENMGTIDREADVTRFY